MKPYIYTDGNGQWSFLNNGLVVKCGSLKECLKVAERLVGRITLPVWNVASQQHESEVLADPNW